MLRFQGEEYRDSLSLHTTRFGQKSISTPNTPS